MARRSLRTLGLWLLWVGFPWVSNSAEASQVRLRSGETYTGVTILRRDAASIEIKVRYGTMVLPLNVVDSVDGVSVNPPPPPRPAVPARPVTARTPEPLAATPMPTPTPAPGPRPVAGTPHASTPPPVEGHGFLPASLEEALAANWSVVLGAVGVLLLWGFTLPRFRRDLRDRGVASRPWTLLVFLLPGLGYVLYRLGRWFEQRSAREHAEAQEAHRFEFLDADQRPIAIDTTSPVFSGIENARTIIENALFKRASDVHIEAAAQEYRVRLRVDGSMSNDRTFSTNDGLRLVSALKTLAQVDISERRKAQDGRFGARQGPRAVDFRLATVPSVHGEKVVLRILDRKSGVRGLNDLGMPREMMDRFAQIVHSRSGMILATGPTGSGKTSTLYAALAQLDATQLNLVTIEDPVEYELAGATQIPVNARAGVTYESGLRSILRQDPDVILVGEMRDLESAQIALRAALTGHLVFSSLHTRDAIGAVMRLEEMGIEPHLVASALFVVLSQRLVRVVCDACRQPYSCEGNELLSMGIELNPGETVYRAVGCRKCEGTGYLGRTGIFEMLVLDEEIRQPVNNGIEEDDLLKLARQKGFSGFREDGAMKVLLGITTVDEVLRSN